MCCACVCLRVCLHSSQLVITTALTVHILSYDTLDRVYCPRPSITVLVITIESAYTTIWDFIHCYDTSWISGVDDCILSRKRE